GADVREALDELRSGGWERSARDAATVPLVDTGASVTGPAGGELPILISPLVDARFGPIASLGIPAVDEADREIARRAERVIVEEVDLADEGDRPDRAGQPSDRAFEGSARLGKARRTRAND